MALLSAQAPNIQGAAMTYSAANSSETAVPGSNVYLHVKTGGTGTTVTVVQPGQSFGEDLPDIDVTIGTNTDRHIGPLVAALASAGVVTINYSSTTSVTAALLQFG